MKRFLGAAVVVVLFASQGSPARADEKDATAVIDKAIKALGGEEKLAKARVITWKIKGTLTFDGNDGEIKGSEVLDGLDRDRRDFEADVNGTPVVGAVVLSGDKGWRKFGEAVTELDADAVAGEKRNAYLQHSTVLLLPLKGKGFKLVSAPDEKVGDKPASVVTVTGPDGKDFTLYFDKASGLPIKRTAKVTGFTGEEYSQEATFADYLDFDGIKKYTKVVFKRDGERFLEESISEFKILDKADADTFTEPK